MTASNSCFSRAIDTAAPTEIPSVVSVMSFNSFTLTVDISTLSDMPWYFVWIPKIDV